jgi:hypothetical protein
VRLEPATAPRHGSIRPHRRRGIDSVSARRGIALDHAQCNPSASRAIPVLRRAECVTRQIWRRPETRRDADGPWRNAGVDRLQVGTGETLRCHRPLPTQAIRIGDYRPRPPRLVRPPSSRSMPPANRPFDRGTPGWRAAMISIPIPTRRNSSTTIARPFARAPHLMRAGIGRLISSRRAIPMKLSAGSIHARANGCRARPAPVKRNWSDWDGTRPQRSD